jgi:hypothetical protein
MRLFARRKRAAQQHEELLQPAAHDLHSLHAHHYLKRPWGLRQGGAGGAAAAAAAPLGGRAADIGGAAPAAGGPAAPPGHPLTHASALTAYESVLACLIVLHALAFCLLGYKLWRWSVDESPAGGKGAAARRGGSVGGAAGRAPMPPPPLARFPSGANHYTGPLKRGGSGSIQSVRDALKQYVKSSMGKH